MTIIATVINNEQEYLNLIADAIEHGVHTPNQFANLDEDGMSVSDFFDYLSFDDAYEYLGFFTSSEPKPGTIWEETDENGKEWECEKLFPDWKAEFRNTMCLYDDNTIVPTEKDFPIFVYFNWSDDFDRFGKTSTRVFEWFSLSTIINLKETKDKWDAKFKELKENYIKDYEAYYAKKCKAIEESND